MRHQAGFLLLCALLTAGCPLAGLAASRDDLPDLAARTQGPALQAAGGTAQAAEVVGEVRIHGNHATPDAQVVQLAGVQVGSSLDISSLAAIRERLDASGRFARVEVRKRYRSLTDPTDVAIIIIVEEHPITSSGAPVLNSVQRMVRRLQFLPLLGYEEGYGVTYGARASLAEPLGRRSRLTVPLTWGGTRRAAAVIEHEFGPRRASRAEAGVGITRQEHPFYDVSDRRAGAWARVSHTFAPRLTLGAMLDRTDVRFGELDDDATSFGVDATLDLRQDPLFPRNTVFVTAGLERIDPASSEPLQRRRVDAHGYVGLLGQPVLALRALYDGSDDPTPAWRRPMLGGGATLRGHRAGAFAADSILATSVELRVPVNSPIGTARTGFEIFFDAGKAQDAGRSLSDAKWERGAGAGVFVLAPFFQVRLDVASNLRGGVRWHLAAGARF